MKVAVCISGQARTCLHPKVKELFQKNIVEVWQPDIFVDLWDKKGHSAYSEQAGIDISFSNDPVRYEEINEFYKPVYSYIEQYDQWINGLSGDHRSVLADRYGTSLSQFYKLMRVTEKKKEHEDKYGLYDMVIVMRPDLAVFKPLPAYCIRDLNALWSMNCLKCYVPKRIFEAFIVSNSQNIDYYGQCYKSCLTYYNIDTGNGLARYDACRVLWIHYMQKPNARIRSYLDRSIFEVIRQECDFNFIPCDEEEKDIRRRHREIEEQVCKGETPENDFVLQFLINNEFVKVVDGRYMWG